jgi:universal stress protein A
MVRVQSVLCPVDFSEHSRRAFEYAVALAAFHHARLTVLTVIDPLLAQAAAVHCDPEYLRESEAELRAFAGDTSLESISWAPTPRLVVTLGRAGDRILEIARSHEADLIVMGTQGLGGLRKLVFGSTADRVLRRADVPVLAVPLGGASLVSLGRKGPVFGIKARDRRTRPAPRIAGARPAHSCRRTRLPRLPASRARRACRAGDGALADVSRRGHQPRRRDRQGRDRRPHHATRRRGRGADARRHRSPCRHDHPARARPPGPARGDRDGHGRGRGPSPRIDGIPGAVRVSSSGARGPACHRHRSWRGPQVTTSQAPVECA